jgi:uncharacterized membrane protein YgdD (TMEM256/DUF423 family)
MHKNYIAVAATLGGLGVILGAFGAHGLQKITSDEKILHGFQTAVQYQVYHSLALLSVVILADRLRGRWARIAAICFITGIILFSGSLYLITWLKIQDSAAVKWVGPFTPVGGLFFIVGWLSLLIGAVSNRS